MREFAAEQESTGRVVYNVSVEKVGRDEKGMWLDTYTATDDTRCTMQCDAVVMANGVGIDYVPPRLESLGWGAAKSYSDMPTSNAASGYEEYRQFENQRALVVGMGNAAFETVDALAPHTAYVHVMPGRRGRRTTPLYAHETRYVGDLRLMRASSIDSYLLKSLDGGFNAEQFSAEAYCLAKCRPTGRYCVLPCEGSDEAGVQFMWHTKNEEAEAFAGRLHSLGLVIGTDVSRDWFISRVFVSGSDVPEQKATANHRTKLERKVTGIGKHVCSIALAYPTRLTMADRCGFVVCAQMWVCCT